MRPLSLLAVALLATAPALAQDVTSPDTLLVLPGAELDTDWITPGTTTWTLKLVQPMQQDVGTMTETYELMDGEVLRVTETTVPMQGMQQTDSLFADAETLAPRLHRSSGGAVVSLEFMDEGVVGTAIMPGEATEAVMEMTDAPVFDAAWAGEIAQSLPLAEGLVARAPVYSVQGGITDIVYTVTGQEEVTTPDGARTGWTVEMQVGPQTITTVIDTETREVLTTQFSPQPGVVIEIAPAD